METISDCKRKLKYYSSESVMSFCFEISRNLIHQDKHSGYCGIYPWEIESLLMLDIKASPKVGFKSINGTRDLSRIVNIIKEGAHIDAVETVQRKIDLIFPAISLQQFEHQLPIFQLLYRYDYIFNHPSFSSVFTMKYRKTYGEIRDFVYFLYVLMSCKDIYKMIPLIKYWELKNHEIISMLSIDKQELKEQIDTLFSVDIDVLTGICPLYKKPFLVDDGVITIPLPHLLIRSITTSMLFDLTDRKNDVRTSLGKVLEDYAFKLLDDSGIFNEIHPEKVFNRTGGELKTLDVNASDGEKYLLLECKSYVPKLQVRNYSLDAYKRELDILAGYVVKIYKNVVVFRSEYESYNCFKKSNICFADLNDIYCVLVVLDDPYIRRLDIYEEAASRLNIKVGSCEYDWLANHIKIFDYSQLEQIMLTGSNIFDYITGMKQNDFLNGNFRFPTKWRHKGFEQFRKDLDNSTNRIAEECDAAIKTDECFKVH